MHASWLNLSALELNLAILSLAGAIASRSHPIPSAFLLVLPDLQSLPRPRPTITERARVESDCLRSRVTTFLLRPREWDPEGGSFLSPAANPSPHPPGTSGEEQRWTCLASDCNARAGSLTERQERPPAPLDLRICSHCAQAWRQLLLGARAMRLAGVKEVLETGQRTISRLQRPTLSPGA